MNRKVHPLIVALMVVFYFASGVPLVSLHLGIRARLKQSNVDFIASEKAVASAIAKKAARETAMRRTIAAFPISASAAESLRKTIVRLSDRTLTPFHILRMIEIESGGDPKAIGSKGERGLLQIMPWIARPYLERLGRKDLTDPEINVAVGVMEVRRLLVLFDGDLSLALAAYNGGPTRALRYASRVTGAARADNCSTWNEREGVDR